MKDLSVGAIVEAEVTRVEAYGVYLRFHDAEIIVLIFDVSNERIADLKARYRAGERVRVKILEYVPDRQLFKATIKDAGA
jgi:ribosomal protein S1